MRYARCLAGEKVFYARAEGELLHELTAAPYLPYEETGAVFAAGDVRLLAPCEPSTIFAMAGNYLDHLRSEHVDRVRAPQEPRPFVKVVSSIIGPGDTIVLPPELQRIDAEAELVVVMGRRCRRVEPSQALEYVFGYTCGNDVSAREWQRNDLNWWRAKSSDTFTPLGPYLTTGVDGGNLEIVCRINGAEVQQCNTRDLIHDIPGMVSFLSQAVTLMPGDLIFTGTTGVPGRIDDGDTVEVEIESLGVLANPVRREGSRNGG